MSWVRNAWQVAAFQSEITDGLLARRLCDEEIVLYRTSAGRIVAMEDSCPHRLVPLSLGRRIGDEIQCGYHGMCFAPDGACTRVPGQAEIPVMARVRTYPVVERFGFAWIWLGAAELADPALVPDLRWTDLPGWVPATGYLHFAANYRLVTDNLLDLSHETYIHGSTIGTGQEESIADFPVVVSQEHGRLVRCHRELPRITPPPFFAGIIKGLGQVDRVDRWQSAVYMPPGIHLTDVGVYPVGTPREAAVMWRVFHLLTPETENSTHYFWAFCRNYGLDDAAMTRFIVDGTHKTFEEDREMLERQQRNVARRPDIPLPKVGIRLDVAPVQARRMLAALIERERDDPGFVAAPVPLGRDAPLLCPPALAAE